MTDHKTENDEAPEQYIDHFVLLGYSADDLRETWAGLSESARRNYRWALDIPPATTAGGRDE